MAEFAMTHTFWTLGKHGTFLMIGMVSQLAVS
jgi:hypothetical protein